VNYVKPLHEALPGLNHIAVFRKIEHTYWLYGKHNICQNWV